MRKLDLTELREQMKVSLIDYIRICDNEGLPVLFVQPKNDPRAASYVKSKQNILKEVGLTPLTIEIPEDAELSWLQELIARVTMLEIPTLIQLPLPKNMPDDEVATLPHIIDVDRLGFVALGNQNTGSAYNDLKPCTVNGIMTIIENIGYKILPQLTAQLSSMRNPKYKLSGITVTVIGRGALVGRPLSRLLQDMGATVICCSSGTTEEELKTYINMSDIVVSAVGRYGVISANMITTTNPLLIIDAGVSFINGKLHGDFAYDKDNYENILPNVSFTPHIGGVGPMTVLSVAENAARLWDEISTTEGIESGHTDKIIEKLKKEYDVHE